MKELLLSGDFAIEKMLTWKVRPPYGDSPTRAEGDYDFTRLVRSEIFEARWFKYGKPRDYPLWAFTPGTKIINRLSAKEKELVAAFADEVTDKTAIKPPDDKKDGHI
jgi:hypothetical protein